MSAPADRSRHVPETRVTDAPPPETWVAGLRAGDAATFSAVFHAYYERLCGVVQAHVRSRAITEEIVQELFLRLWRSHDRLEVSDLQGYLLRAARNTSLTYLRRCRLERDWEARVAARPSSLAPSAEDVALGEALARAIEQVVAELPERCRLIYTMNRVHGLTYVDIAATLGISPKTVETQMMRALRKLRDRLSAYLP
jgi:RNA polymerase sigma-70 factor, ECF subfamily